MAQRVPAFTVPQPGEAMQVLEEKASQLDVRCFCFTGRLPRIITFTKEITSYINSFQSETSVLLNIRSSLAGNEL